MHKRKARALKRQQEYVAKRLQEEVPPECNVDPWSSWSCVYGTKGCHRAHNFDVLCAIYVKNNG